MIGSVLGNLFKTYGYRVIGAGIAYGATWLAAHHFALDANTVSAISLAVYGIVHTALDKHAPTGGDSTSTPTPGTK